MTLGEWASTLDKARQRVYEAQEAVNDVLRVGWDEGHLDICRLGSAPRKMFVHCHRGGIGCPLEHEGDPPELRMTERVYKKRRSVW